LLILLEAENAQLEEFGEERLLQAARAHNGSALEVQRLIMQRVTAFLRWEFPRRRNLTRSTNLLSAAGNPSADLQQSRGHRSVVETSVYTH
jgi:hypothetical protein